MLALLLAAVRMSRLPPNIGPLLARTPSHENRPISKQTDLSGAPYVAGLQNVELKSKKLQLNVAKTYM